MVLHKIPQYVCVSISVYGTYSSTLLLHPLCVCVLCPSFEMQRCSIFVLHISHQYFTLLLPLLSSFSLFLGHQNEVLSMLHNTPLKDWLDGWMAGWNPIGTVWVASGTKKDLPPPDGCKQSFFVCPFVYNLYLPTVGWHRPTHLAQFSAIHSGAVQYKKSLWHEAI